MRYRLALVPVVLMVAVASSARSEEEPSGHAWLMRLAGEYTTENAFSPAPGAPSRRSVGTATLAPVLGGRFLREESRSEAGAGRSQEALKVWGFDEATGRYQTTWTYTGSTAILLLTGRASAEEDAVVYEGQYVDGQRQRHTLGVELRPLGPDRFRLGVRSFGDDGQEKATLVTTYTRTR